MDSSAIFTVGKALSEMSSADETLRLLTDDNGFWNMFGKKDSHLLRAKLFKIFGEAKLDQETRFMVYFFFSVIKNRTRVLASFEELPPDVKALPAVTKAKEFILNYLVQYTSQESSKKFAVVHLPTTMPGLDIMITALTSENSMASMESRIYTKQTFCQLNLNSELQSINKAAQQMLWDTVIKSSKNEARVAKTVTEDLKFHSNFYDTSASDKYNLVDINMKEIPPTNAALGYTKKDMETWFQKIKKDQENKSAKKKIEAMK